MADEERSEPTSPADRPPGPKSPWEPAEAPSPWAPAAPPEPPAAATPPPDAPPPSTPEDPVELPEPTEAWDNPLASPEAWVNPLAEESRATPPPSTPPPAWQVGGPTAGWGETAVTVPARAPGPRRPILMAAAVGAVVGALVAGLVVAAVKDDKAAAPGRPLTFSNNTSKIARTGDIQEILSKV